MEEQSTNNISSKEDFSVGNLSSSTLVQLDATNATALSPVESRQPFSNSSTSFREMLEAADYDTNNDIDLNVPYAPPIYDRSFLTAPHCTNCGQKRKTPDGSSGDDEASHRVPGDCHCGVTLAHICSPQSINPSGPSISQGPSNLGEETSGDHGNSNVLCRIAHNYRNVRLRGRPENVRRSLPPSHDPLSGTPFTYWNARTSINRQGEVTHNIQAPRTSIASQLGNWDGSPNSTNQVALRTGAQNTGTRSNQYISLLGHIIPPPIRPVYNSLNGSNVAVQHNGGPVGMNMSRFNEGNGGNIHTMETDRSIFIQRVWANARRRELIALRANNAPVPMANAPLAPSSWRAGQPGHGLTPQLHQDFPDDNIEEEMLLALVDHVRGHLTGHAESQGQVTDIHGRDDRQNNLELNLEGMSDQQLADLLYVIRVNTRLSEEDILQGLNPRRYRLSRTNDDEEEICCICLDELGNGQDLVKLDCGHRYHFECIKQWLAEKNSCAVCKKLAIPC